MIEVYRIPFDVPQVFKDGMPMGRGIIRQITGTVNTDISVTHNLGRIPNLVMPLDNGTSLLPRWKRGAAAWTINAVNVNFDVAPSSMWLWIV